MKTIKSLFVCLLSTLTIISCNTSRTLDSNASMYADYVKAYTGGMVQSSSSIKIEFASAANTSVPTDKLFSFSPSLKGEAKWLGANLIEFTPLPGELKPGKTYSVSFKLDKVFPIQQSDIKKFEFSFVVAQKQAVLEIKNLLINTLTPEFAQIGGEISLSEPVDIEELKTILKCSAVDASKTVKKSSESSAESSWFELKQLSPQNFSFISALIPRKSKDYEAEVVLNIDKLGFKSKCKSSIIIPAMGNFKVFSAKLVSSNEPCIEVQFTEALNSNAHRKENYDIEGVGRSYAQVENNILRIFYENTEKKNIKLVIYDIIKGADGQKLPSDWNAVFKIDDLKPSVEILAKGNILPDVDNLVLPFRAVNLNAVDVKIIKIYQSNVMHFLQDNDYDGSSEIRRSGRLIYKKRLRLDSEENLDLHKWNNFSIDLSKLVKKEPGAIYRVCFSFKKEYSIYGKNIIATSSEETGMTSLSSGDLSKEDDEVWDEPSPYYYENYYDWSKYNWKDIDNPMTDSYYMQSSRFPSINILTTDFALTVKGSDSNKLWVSVNSIMTAQPLSGISVTAYNYQLKELASVKTDSKGFAQLECVSKPFMVVAQNENSKTYLKLVDGQENPMSKFDTGGTVLQKGLNAFIYGERGVWRPGDTLHLVLLVDANSKLPSSHPAKLELYTPQGQFYSNYICPSGQDGFYLFDVPTKADDPTGNWHAYFKIGGASFHKSLPIETIKPNRLKVKLDIDANILEASGAHNMTVKANWLSGPVASGLSVKAEMELKQASSSFKSYQDYFFTNPLVDYSKTNWTLFERKLNSEGKVDVYMGMPDAKTAPGMLMANIVTRVAEPGGEESIVVNNYYFSPFESYVGVRFPKAENGFLETDKEYNIDVLTVNPYGDKISGRNLEYTIYRLQSEYWWETSKDNLLNYVRSKNAVVHSSGRLNSSSNMSIPLKVEAKDWGKYLVLVSDKRSGHISGGVIFVDWPMWRRAERHDASSATILSFNTDKTNYTSGEEVTVYVPAAENAMALLSVENGTQVLLREWIKTNSSDWTAYKFKLTEQMAPNCYIHLSLIQPHKKSENGRPLRMYGVCAIQVENPHSHLYPILTVPDVIRPQTEFAIKVRETNSKPMTYTLAIVDEGILDLNSFKTPNPWQAMYKRQALGIKTWDMYDNVIGAYSGQFASMYSVGGDGELSLQNKNRDSRFNPVVKFMGPFKLNRGENTHKVKLPMYVGSVRIMLVAASSDAAYGNAEKTVAVRNPLMVLSSAPRVLGHNETFSLPVNVFAMEKDIGNVKVKIDVEGDAICEESSKSISFNGVGDQLVKFNIKTGTKDEVLKIKVQAQTGEYTANEEISIPVRNPNLPLSSITKYILSAGEAKEFSYATSEQYSTDGEYFAKLEATTFPSININAAFNYVQAYQHQCTEQISAKGITYISLLNLLDKSQRKQVEESIPELLQSLYLRQSADGGFTFWQSGTYTNTWASIMAGHFMSLASAEGFDINPTVYGKWKEWLRKKARSYRGADGYDQQQAYSLYVLALAGAQESNMMNRLKEMPNLTSQASYLLASAYSLTGKKAIAEGIISSILEETVSKSQDDFYSSSRELAIKAEALVLAGHIDQALEVTNELSSEIVNNYYTTQTTAFASIAMSRIAKLMAKNEFKLDITNAGKTQTIRSANSTISFDLSREDNKIVLKNNSDGMVYITINERYKPRYDMEIPQTSSGIELQVRYTDSNGNTINPEFIRQGTDFTAKISVRNTSPVADYTNLALVMLLPSGWEIFNERFFSESSSSSSYEDIRDDRYQTYFNLPAASQKEFKVRMTAVYEGEYVLPQISCEAMYDNKVYACTKSSKTKVFN